jgi:hypothetical protein
MFLDWFLLIVTTLIGSLLGKQAPTGASSAPVPQLVNYSGKATDAQGGPIAGIAGITFSIYKDQYDGAPLWMETQNENADAKGNYAVHLGAMRAEGLPLDLFTSGEARWLGVRVNGGEEAPAVLLLSVPYALKAADAQTLGGLPASAFVLSGTWRAAQSLRLSGDIDSVTGFRCSVSSMVEIVLLQRFLLFLVTSMLICTPFLRLTFQNASEHRHLLALQCLESAPSSRDADDQTLLIPWSICRATPVLLSYFLG